MLRNYTISSLKQLKGLPSMDLVQFTSNSRQFPNSRNTVEVLKIIESFSKTRVLVHWDYIYIISRYALFADNVKFAILDELHSILDYCDRNSQVLGIVMHTDFPIRKDVVNGKLKMTDSFKSPIWDKDEVLSYSNHIDKVVIDSILKFRLDYLAKYPLPKAPIYLENTTKKGPNGEGTFEWLLNLIQMFDLRDMFGICYDSEHYYAVEGKLIDSKDLATISSQVRLLVHINTIPDQVKPGSGLDRHSETTIFECSVNNVDYYRSFINDLEFFDIDYIREVKYEAMLRELKQIDDAAGNF